MVRNLTLVLLLICFPNCSRGKHLLRFLTFCQRDVPDDGQYDIEYDGDQLLYVDPVTYQAVPRLPEFAEQWTPDPRLAKDIYVSLGTCKYNIPRAIKGEHSPPEVIVSPTSLIYWRQEVELGVPNMLICFVNDFHPPVVDITWTRNGQLVDESEVSRTQYYSNSDFSFRTASYLNFTPHEEDIYSCTVDHISLQAALTRFWETVIDQISEAASNIGPGYPAAFYLGRELYIYIHTEVEVNTDHQTTETSVCAFGVILGLMGVVTGLWFIMKANKPRGV